MQPDMSSHIPWLYISKHDKKRIEDPAKLSV